MNSALHHGTGSPAARNDYEPHVTPLPPKEVKRIATSGGRLTNSDLPYFNIEWPGRGVIVALGWPGQRAADFRCDDGTGLRVRGGQELTHFQLHPGEEVRTPLAVVQFWKGDFLRWAERCSAPLEMSCAQPASARRKTDAAGTYDCNERFLPRHEEQRRGENGIR